jgi:ABC-type oligopeptide transport system substrate-binding subunit
VIEHIARGLNALAIVTILVAAQPVAAADTVHSWSVAGTLRVGLSDAPNTLDPILATQVSETFLATLSFDGLVRTHQDGSIEPALAVAVPSLEKRHQRGWAYHRVSSATRRTVAGRLPVHQRRCRILAARSAESAK